MPWRAPCAERTHVSFDALGLPNAPSSLTAFTAFAVASSSSFASRNVPRRPISLSPSAPVSSASSLYSARRRSADALDVRRAAARARPPRGVDRADDERECFSRGDGARVCRVTSKSRYKAKA